MCSNTWARSAPNNERRFSKTLPPGKKSSWLIGIRACGKLTLTRLTRNGRRIKWHTSPLARARTPRAWSIDSGLLSSTQAYCANSRTGASSDPRRRRNAWQLREQRGDGGGRTEGEATQIGRDQPEIGLSSNHPFTASTTLFPPGGSSSRLFHLSPISYFFRWPECRTANPPGTLTAINATGRLDWLPLALIVQNC